MQVREKKIELRGVWAFLLSLAFLGCTIEVHTLGDGVVKAPPEPLDSDVVLETGPGGDDELITTDLQSQSIQPFQIESVDPKWGPDEGGTRVQIYGAQLGTVQEVYFGNQKAKSWVSLGPDQISADTPAGTPGPVSVSVLRSDGSQATLPAAFTYQRALVVSEVVPASGPLGGGTPFVVHGKGFVEESNVLVGGRQALSVAMIDDGRLTGVTPAGHGGPADVLVYNAAEFARIKDAYRYEAKLELTRVFPPNVGPSGGVVTLEGLGLDLVEEVMFGDVEGVILDRWLGGEITLEVPPSEAGTVDVVARSLDAQSALLSGFAFVSDSEQSSEILSLCPAQGSEEGGTPLLLTVSNGDEDTLVFFGDEAAMGTLLTPHTLEVLAPPGSGEVLLGLGSPAENEGLSFHYIPSLSVQSVEPNQGIKTGGESVRITLSGVEEGAEIFFGPLPVQALTWVGENVVEVVTPPGSPGYSAVRVVDSGVEGTLDGAFEFLSDTQDFAGFKPIDGAISGGTFFRLFGEGFEQEVAVYFGEVKASYVTRVSGSEVQGYTPTGEVGPVNVTLETGVYTETLEESFTYFNPASSFGGTWGGALDETVNVTVLDMSTGEGVVDAFVILDAQGNTPYQGWTNDVGQVAFGGANLLGKQTVTAAKSGYTSNSVVSFDATNVVLMLYSVTPSPSDPVEPLPIGSISGRVLAEDKFISIPISYCSGLPEFEDGFCKACELDSDCSISQICAGIDGNNMACTSGCVADEDCPEGTRCGGVQEMDMTVCVPSVWSETARCSLSDSSLYAALSGLNGWVDAVYDEGLETFTYTLDSRLGDVAVFCQGGWVESVGGTFLPKTLGVKRHIFVQPGSQNPDQDVSLSIPLNRALEVRFDLPGHTEKPGLLYALDVVLELGTDGWKGMGLAASFQSTQSLALESLPEGLTGPLYDASYLLYGGVYQDAERGIPYSVAQESEVLLESGEHVFSFSDETSWVGEASGLENDVFSVAIGSGEAIAVGANGIVLARGEAGNWTQKASPTNANLHGVAVAGSSLVVAVGDSGTIVERVEGEWLSMASPTQKNLRGVWLNEEGYGWAVGWHVVIARTPNGWVRLDDVPPLNLYGLDSLGDGTFIAVGDQGRILHWDGVNYSVEQGPTVATLRGVWAASSELAFAVSEAGECLIGEGASWTEMGGIPGSGALKAIQGRFGLQGLELWVVGEEGRALRYDGNEWESLPLGAPTDLESIALYASGNELLVVGRAGIVLGPFVPIPEIVVSGGSGGTPYQISLESSPEFIPSFRYGQVISSGGFPVWTWMVDGESMDFQLPNLVSLIDWDLLSMFGGMDVRMYSVHDPSFDIDKYTNFELNLMSWSSWSLTQTPLP